eukprot:jgi/Chlat1/1145/Chrsp112S01622
MGAVAWHEQRLLLTSLGPEASATLRRDGKLQQGSMELGGASAAARLLVDKVAAGAYVDALRAAPFASSAMLEASAPGGFISALRQAVAEYLAEGESTQHAWRCLSVLSAGAAALSIATQANVTGPLFAEPDLARLNDVVGSAVHLSSNTVGGQDGAVWEGWARSQVCVDGEDLVGKSSLLPYLVLARELLVEVQGFSPELLQQAIGGGSGRDELSTSAWWAARCILLQQRLLTGRCPSLQQLLFPLYQRAASSCQPLERTAATPGAEAIAATCRLEAAVAHYVFGHMDSVRQLCNDAAAAMHLELQLTGALGFRTHYQVDPKAQMVLIATSSAERPADIEPSAAAAEGDDLDAEVTDADVGQEEDILLAPRLVPEGGQDHEELGALSPTEQAVVLAYCMHTKRNRPVDDLRGYEMVPFIEAVGRQKVSCPAVRAAGLRLRAQHERERSRTRERALLQLHRLVEAQRESKSTPAQRMQLVHAVVFPPVPVLHKELGEQLLASGNVGSALQIFELLELWDNLIECYRMLGKTAQCMTLVKERLAVSPDEPRLWCALGTLTRDDSHFVTAWEKSNKRYARAQRLLALSAYNRSEYATAIEHWEISLRINPLYPDVWFSLGYAALKVQDYDRAVQAYTRVAQLEPDNGEAWNNIAAVAMQRGRMKEAFSALSEAIKYRRESWQTWENYASAAVDIGNHSAAVHGLRRLFDLSSGQRISAPVLGKVVDALTASGESYTAASQASSEAETSTSEAASAQAIPGRPPPPEERLERETLQLLNQLVVSGAADAQVWAVKARLHHWRGEHVSASECALKHCRALQGNGWQRNATAFTEYAQASMLLGSAYLSSGSTRDLASARMHLRSVLKQAAESFEDTEDYKMLHGALQEVTDKEKALSAK